MCTFAFYLLHTQNKPVIFLLYPHRWWLMVNTRLQPERDSKISRGLLGKAPICAPAWVSQSYRLAQVRLDRWASWREPNTAQGSRGRVHTPVWAPTTDNQPPCYRPPTSTCHRWMDWGGKKGTEIVLLFLKSSHSW